MSYLQRFAASNQSATRGPRLMSVMVFTLALAGWMYLGLATATAQNKIHAKSSDTIHLVALGDSLTAGYGLAPNDGFVPQLQAALAARGVQVKVHNGGVSGDTSAGGLARFDWVMVPEAKAVIIELGANDMLRGIAPEVTEKNLRALIEKSQKRGLEVMLVGMYAAPNLGAVYGDKFNRLYSDLARQYGLVFYPFFLDGVAANPRLNLADGIHPNADGIKIIVKNILPTVEKLLARITS